VSVWDRLRAALRREAKDAKELLDDTTARGNRAMDQRERELNATPEEKLAIEQERIAANDTEFEELRRKLEG
jgi:hypothetical protein